MHIQVKQFQVLILKWFDQHGRKELPWQQPRTPYRVWVSEIMLQQTQVNTVIPYFQRFIERFPDIRSLALATDDAVLEMWAGLGFYARARNLHATAKILFQQYASQFPEDLALLQTLPGIGRSTAGAIFALGMNKPAPILDGNVKRVLSRLFAVTGPTNDAKVLKQLWALAETYMANKRPADYVQAFMDLGALVCTPTQPSCKSCPLVSQCLAYAQGTPTAYPTPKQQRALPVKSVNLVILLNAQKEVLLEKRPPAGIWGGLWSLPECASSENIQQWCQKHYQCQVSKQQNLPAFRHTFSHFHLDITPVLVKVKKSQPAVMESLPRVWYNLATPGAKGLPAPIKKLLHHAIQL